MQPKSWIFTLLPLFAFGRPTGLNILRRTSSVNTYSGFAGYRSEWNPPDAKSTTYDLVEGQRRYPPKLVTRSPANMYPVRSSSGSLFSGGEASPAFALLRKLHFHIERKDFVPGLMIRQFLSQAAAADDLSTKNYPKSYRGLQVAVSFGKGNFGKIPWISFLGYGQKTPEGIYPVYLFYREVEVLILAYGVSETKSPDTHPLGRT